MSDQVKKLDRSELEFGEVLGRGGYGIVRKGKWKNDGEMPVAIAMTEVTDPAVIPQEIKVWSCLPQHRNITTLIGIASGDFTIHIVMEFAVNGSLYDYLYTKKNKPSVERSLGWASDVAHGMKHLHDHHIIHRDLKSASVLLTEGLVAKLYDFGIPREINHTITTMQAGIYRWMAPEIMKSVKARINKKCDLFSYGMILFELFAHEKPYATLDSEAEVIIKVLAGERPPIPPTLPPYLHGLLRSCWEEDPHLRPTFDDFVDKEEKKGEATDTDSAADIPAPADSTHSGEGKGEEEETDSAADTTTPTDFTHSGEGKGEEKEAESAVDTTAPTDLTHSGEKKGAATDTDSAADTTAPTDFTHTGEGRAEPKKTGSTAATTVKKLDHSKLQIGDLVLGRGMNGFVREGKWKDDREMSVAIKKIDVKDAAEVPKEVKVWSSLPKHRNITTLIEVASEGFTIFIIMELAVNGSLFGHLHIKESKPSVERSLGWASDVAHGMKHLHDNNIIHGDLKSPNVLLTSEWVAKLCDFGSARELDHTTTTALAGTYRWMAPEIMKAERARINKKCDLFSYGMILFELFEHKKPYADADGNIQISNRVLAGERPPIPPTLPPDFHDLLRSCWEEDPHLRPTFDDFVNMINANS